MATVENSKHSTAVPNSLQRLHISESDHMSELRVRRAAFYSWFSSLATLELERLASVWSLSPSSVVNKVKYLAFWENGLNYSQGSAIPYY